MLREGRLAGAGLDIFHQEPLPRNPLQGLDNVVLSPQPSYHVPDEASPLVLTSYWHTFAPNIEQQWAALALKPLF